MTDKDANKMWGGRFAMSPSELMVEINASIGFDKAMAPQDIRGSKAHAEMLAAQKIISTDDAAEIVRGLDQVAAEIEAGRFQFSTALEDIHLNVESRLTEIVGEAGRRLHTARSRNDQVALDFRMYVRDAIDHLTAALVQLQQVLAGKALVHAGTIMPGFTHLQPAQPVTFGHHLLAYVEMLDRDRGRLTDARRRLNECPLGSAALAGTSFPIDRDRTAAALGFDRPTANSLDAVADRDFACDLRQPALDGREIAAREDAARSQHACVREGALDVVLREAPVEADGGGKALDGLGDRLAETARPWLRLLRHARRMPAENAV